MKKNYTSLNPATIVASDGIQAPTNCYIRIFRE